MPKKYLAWIFVFGIFLPLVVVFMINVVVDPYSVWGSGSILGVNARKPLFTDFERISKAYEIRRLKPHGIVLGSSRAERGIDPDHPAWPTDGNYNLCLRGISLEEIQGFLNHSIGVSDIEVVVYGLDFFTFNACQKTHEQYDPDILASEIFDSGWILEALRLSASTKTLLDSWRSFRMQNSPEALLGPLKNGRLNDNDMRNNIVEWGGQRAAFERNEQLSMSLLYNANGQRYDFVNEDTSTFDQFRKILATCHENDIRLFLFISPTHARQLELIAYTDLWGKFEEWKRQLVIANEAVAEQFGKEPFALHDFSGYNAWTSEPLPVEEGTEARMKYYWESSHYTRELGDIVLETLFSNTERADGFGNKLTSENVEDVLQSIREERSWYAQHFRSEIESFETAIERRLLPTKLFGIRPRVRNR